MNYFTTNRTIQNIINSRIHAQTKTIENKRQEKLDAGTLKKLKLVEKAFK